MDTLKQGTDKRISDLEELHSAEKDKLAKHTSDLENKIKPHARQSVAESDYPMFGD